VVKLTSFADLANALRSKGVTSPKAEMLRPSAWDLYYDAKQLQAQRQFAGAMDQLERALSAGNLPEEARRLILARRTVLSRIGHDDEAKALLKAAESHFENARSLLLLDWFRLKHKLAQPQRALGVPGIAAISSISVYRWAGDLHYGEVWSQLIRKAKEGDKTTLTLLGVLLAQHWQSGGHVTSWWPEIDMVVPVPPNPTRAAEREVDIVGWVAERFCQAVGLPLFKEVLRRSSGARSREASPQDLASQYTMPEKYGRLVRGRVVLLIDDVVTTGKTARVCAELLRASGAAPIYLLTLAQAESTLTEQRHLGERTAKRVQEIAPWLCLAGTKGLGPVRARSILSVFGTPQAALDAGTADLVRARDVGPKIASAVAEQGGKLDAHRNVAAEMLAAAGRCSGGILTAQDPLYPKVLASSQHGVIVLYALGHGPQILTETRTVAIVGTRHPTRETADITRRIAIELARAGWIVVSGLAEGCDAIAHAGALDGGGATFAFLGNGVDTIYPPSNKALRERIIAHGWLLSEYPFGTRVQQDFLRKRNNLTVGASRVTIIMQSARDGGTMNAARSAKAQNRPLLCLPPPAQGDERFSGNYDLLNQGLAIPLDLTRVVAQVETLAKAVPYD
jgi:DNA processing protein